MPRIPQLIGQVILYGLFAAVIAYFATQPAYTHLDPDKALIKLSFSHAAQHIHECKRLSQEELNRLPPNMRRPMDCPRGRVPLLVEMELDGKIIYRDTLDPSGLAKDGATTAYKKIPVTAGTHHLIMRLRDTNRTEGFDHQKAGDITLAPQQNFVVDFRPELGGFLFL